MKKFIFVFLVCLVNFNMVTYAGTLGDKTQILLDYFNVEVTEDISGIEKLQNRRLLKNPALVSAGINSGIAIPLNGIFDEASTDYTPLINGLVKRYVVSNSHKITTGSMVSLTRNKNLLINDKTIVLAKAELNYNTQYTCVSDKDNNVLFMWETGAVKQPSLYRAKLYWYEDNKLVVTDVSKKEFDLWIKAGKENFYTFDTNAISLSDNFLFENLDKYVYIFADDYDGKLIANGISN